ncbi:helix-turn-helix domain-containing protein [Pseudomonas sp. AN-1]|uniref:helix-turn-helix domain-containing protein n=1 Tax=Pseudomonas sp. AN-1 TaxID=3096605 RepID=UPI002A6A6D91|nr:helix-turn-helix domain-containing protein [Pseudomonas sp. AN-1]WPP44234.1 helix-turn-helix domain-containing protein [Pseudomonas sp. AN-1]
MQTKNHQAATAAANTADTTTLLLTSADAAQMLGICTNTLAVWRSTGRYNLPFIKVGRCVRYRLSDLTDFMTHRTALHTGQVTRHD